MERFPGNLMKPSRRQFSWALPAVLELVRHALFFFLWSFILCCLLLSAHLLSSLQSLQSLKLCLGSPSLGYESALDTRCSANIWPSAVPVSQFKLSRKVIGSWPATGMAGFASVLFTVARGKSHLAWSYWLEWSLWERMWEGQENWLMC